jgi:hypothetical protein
VVEKGCDRPPGEKKGKKEKPKRKRRRGRDDH